MNSTIGKSPTLITLEVIINAPIDKVWKEFSNIGDIYLSSPTVAHSYTSSEIKQGIGTTRHMKMSLVPGAELSERVLQWEEGRYLALEVYEIKGMPGVKTMGGNFALTAQGDKTVLLSTLNYSMSNGLFGLMNKLIMRNQFIKIWGSILAGYKKHIETGETVTSKTKLDTKLVKLIALESGAPKAAQLA